MATKKDDRSSDLPTTVRPKKLVDFDGNSKKSILVAIHPEDLETIITRAKNHDFRRYLVPNHVKEFWLYQTAPLSAVTHVAVVGLAKRPGAIAEDGLKNHEFNTDTNVKTRDEFAYPIEELYKLPDPVTLTDMIEFGWESGPPIKYCYVQKDMVEKVSAVGMERLF